MRASAAAWVELYTDHGPLSLVAIGEERTTEPEIALADILLIMDRVLAG